MILDTARPVEEWFDLPNYGDVLRQHDVQVFVDRHPFDLLARLYDLIDSPNNCLLIPSSFEIIPQQLQIGEATVDVKSASHFKKLAWYPEIHDSDPQLGIRETLSGVSYESSCLGYSCNVGRVRKKIPFTSCIEGLELFAVCFGDVSAEVYKRTGIIFNTDEPKIYGNELVWSVPSRHKKRVDSHLTKLTSLPTKLSGNDWRLVDFEHTCEDAVYKFRSRYFCDHVVAAYRTAQLFSPSGNPILTYPFVIPREGIYSLYDIMRYRVVREHQNGERDILNEAERGRIFGWLVAYHNRNLDMLFRDNFDGYDWNQVVTVV